MPEIKNTFVQGKMNKDLDERLIPNGQYRHAHNIEVSTSEEAGAGTVQNILGNTLVGDVSTGWLDSCRCVGSIADEKSDKLYYFVHCSGSARRDAILEYDSVSQQSSVILCDLAYLAGLEDSDKPPLQPFLKFSGKQITAINIIDDFLFWTDGESEPKKVNIKLAKKRQSFLGGGTSIGHHSRYWTDPNAIISDDDPYVQEHHLTVIKRKPLTAPRIKAKATGDGNHNQLFEKVFPRFSTRYKYKDGEYSAVGPFTDVVFSSIHADGFNAANYFDTGESYNTSMVNSISSVELYGFVESTIPEDVVQIDILVKTENSASIYSVASVKKTDDAWNETSSYVKSLNAEIEEAKSTGTYEIKSEAIRAVLPENQLLRSWDNVPKKALAQEVTGNRIVYGNYTQGYDLKDYLGESITNDLTAKYQKRAGTWVFDESGGVDGKPSIKSQRTYQLGILFGDKYGRETPIFTDAKNATVHIPWADTTGGLLNPLLASNDLQLLSNLSNSSIPFWADYYKIFVKNTDGEYYNLVMDTCYVTDTHTEYENKDGHVWVSFASSDINKISTEDYLIVKKLLKPGSASNQVSSENRYKILDISDEAPDAIKFKFNTMGRAGHGQGSTSVLDGSTMGDSDDGDAENAIFTDVNYRIDSTPSAITGQDVIKISKDKWNANTFTTLDAFDDTAFSGTIFLETALYMSWRVGVDSFSQSKKYKVQTLNLESGEYTVKLTEPISVTDANMAKYDDSDSQPTRLNPNLEFLIERKDLRPKEEFSGKFFAKVKSTQSLQGVLEDAENSLNVSQISISQDIFNLANDDSSGTSLYNTNTGLTNMTDPYVAPNYGDGNDIPSDLNTHQTTNISNLESDWAALLNDRPNGYFFVDRMYFASESKNQGEITRAHMSGHPFGIKDGSTANGHFYNFSQLMWTGENYTSPHSSQLMEILNTFDFQSNPTSLISSLSGGVYNFEQDYSWFFFNSDSVDGVNSHTGGPEDKALKAFGWAPRGGLVSTLKTEGLEPIVRAQILGTNIVYNEDMSVVDANADHMYNGIEGVVTATSEHASGSRRWINNVPGIPDGIVFDNVYEEGKHYLHVSFLAPGVDLHDGIIDFEDKTINGPLGLGDQLQGIWGGGAFTSGPGFNSDSIPDLTNSEALPFNNIMPVDFDNIQYATDDTALSASYSNLQENAIKNYWYLTFLKRSLVVELEGNYSTNNFSSNALEDAPSHNIASAIGYDTDYETDHKRQWDPLYFDGEVTAETDDIADFLYHIRQPGAKFRFSGDQDEKVYTINSVKEKRLYNHTPWKTRYYYDDVDGKWKGGGDSVEEALVNWASYCKNGNSDIEINANNSRFPHSTLGNVSGIMSSIYNVNLDIDVLREYITPKGDGVEAAQETLRTRIQNFGKANNRRLLFILELDEDPREHSPNFNIVGGELLAPDVDNPTGMEFLADSGQLLTSALQVYPSIVETEPKEKTALNIYYEASDAVPLDLHNKDKREIFAPVGCKVEFPNLPEATSIYDNFILISHDNDNPGQFTVASSEGEFSGPAWYSGINEINYAGQIVKFVREDSSYTTGIISLNYENSMMGEDGALSVYGNQAQTAGVRTKFIIEKTPHSEVALSWHNCYSFGDGIESNRVRDDFNEMQITNGARASATLEEPYAEEHRKSGMIYSGIYNSNSGVNNLNQFIAAEKITKDINPTYGSIQKLYSRATDLVALCEDRIIKILANKDALFNADGTPQLVATENVLGQAVPFVGDYGISKNPESFASESYRAYFADKQRRAVLRLSMDGLTPISDAGMHDWFRDNLSRDDISLLGTYDNYKKQYNLTLTDRVYSNLISNSTFNQGTSLQSITFGSNIVPNSSIVGGLDYSEVDFQSEIYSQTANGLYTAQTETLPTPNPRLNHPITLRHHFPIPAGSLVTAVENIPGNNGPSGPTYNVAAAGDPDSGVLMFQHSFSDFSFTMTNPWTGSTTTTLVAQENLFNTSADADIGVPLLKRVVDGHEIPQQPLAGSLGNPGWRSPGTAPNGSGFYTGFTAYPGIGGPMDQAFYLTGDIATSEVAFIESDIYREIGAHEPGGYYAASNIFHDTAGNDSSEADIDDLLESFGVEGLNYLNLYDAEGSGIIFHNIFYNGYNLDNYVEFMATYPSGQSNSGVSDTVLNWYYQYNENTNALNEGIPVNVNESGVGPYYDHRNATDQAIFAGEEICIRFSGVIFANSDNINAYGGYVGTNDMRFWIQIFGDGELITEQHLVQESSGRQYVENGVIDETGSYAWNVMFTPSDDVNTWTNNNNGGEGNGYSYDAPRRGYSDGAGWADLFGGDIFQMNQIREYEIYYKFQDTLANYEGLTHLTGGQVWDDYYTTTYGSYQNSPKGGRKLYDKLTFKIGVTGDENKAFDTEDNPEYPLQAAIRTVKCHKVASLESPGVQKFEGTQGYDAQPAVDIPGWCEVIYPIGENGDGDPTDVVVNNFVFDWNISTWNGSSGISGYLSYPYAESIHGPANPSNETIGWTDYVNNDGETITIPDSVATWLIPNPNGVEEYIPNEALEASSEATYYDLPTTISGASSNVKIANETVNGASRISTDLGENELTPGRWYMLDIYYEGDWDNNWDTSFSKPGIYAMDVLGSGDAITLAEDAGGPMLHVSAPVDGYYSVDNTNYPKGYFGGINQGINNQGNIMCYRTTNTSYSLSNSIGEFNGQEVLRAIFKYDEDTTSTFEIGVKYTDITISDMFLFDITDTSYTGTAEQLMPWQVDGEFTWYTSAGNYSVPHAMHRFVTAESDNHLNINPKCYTLDDMIAFEDASETNIWYENAATWMPSEPSSGSYLFEFEVYKNPFTETIDGNLMCEVCNSLGDLDEELGTASLHRITGITHEGTYKVNINFDNTSSVVEQPEGANISLYTVETESGYLQDRIRFRAAYGETFTGAVDDIRLIDQTEFFIGGSIGDWNTAIDSSLAEDYDDATIANIVAWDSENESVQFTEAPYQDLSGTELVRLYQNIDSNEISNASTVLLSFDYDVAGIVDDLGIETEPNVGLNVYYYNSNGEGFLIEDLTGEGTFSQEFTIGQSSANANNMLECLVFTPSQSPEAQYLSVIPTLTASIDNISLSVTSSSFFKQTVSYSEDVNGWISFKSFIPESGLSLSKQYYTMKGGKLWQHYTNDVHNNFYSEQSYSVVDFIFNASPSVIKSFNTLNYEGSQAQKYIYENFNSNADTIINNLSDHNAHLYDSDIDKTGWYSSWFKTDQSRGKALSFKEKEGKWFANISGAGAGDQLTSHQITYANSYAGEHFNVQGVGIISSATSSNPENGAANGNGNGDDNNY